MRCAVEINLSNGGILSPSVMCADLINLENDIQILKNNGVEYLHVDFMDNNLVNLQADNERLQKLVQELVREGNRLRRTLTGVTICLVATIVLLICNYLL